MTLDTIYKNLYQTLDTSKEMTWVQQELMKMKAMIMHDVEAAKEKWEAENILTTIE